MTTTLILGVAKLDMTHKLNTTRHEISLMGLCYIQVDTTNQFNKLVGLVFNLWNLFDLSDPFN